MSVVAHFSVPAIQFALGDALKVDSGVEIQLESMIPIGEVTVPYFWAPTDHAESIRTGLRESSLVESVRIVDEIDEEALFRVEWAPEVDGLIETIADADAVVLEGRGDGDHWTFRARFPDRADLADFYQSCIDKGIAIDLTEIDDPPGTAGRRTDRITDEQREALLLALEEGYFAVPRQITLVELAERLGISDSATSQRIRRGLTTLLAATFRSEPKSGIDET